MTIATLLATSVTLSGPAWAGTRGYFPCAVLRFFGPCPPPSTDTRRGLTVAGRTLPTFASPAAPGSAALESLWAEPDPRPDGRGQLYVPPRPVRDFLEAPTPERAKAYLEWNRQRLQAIARAVEVLRLVDGSHETQAKPQSLETGAALGSDLTSARNTPASSPDARDGSGVAVDARGGPLHRREEGQLRSPTETRDRERQSPRVQVVYAFASWCPYSARQTPIVASWARSRPDLSITGVLFDSPPDAAAQLDALPFPVHAGSPALRDRLGVHAYPTVILFKDGAPIRTLSGLTPVEHLEDASRALAM
jgi:thiol-disulfide isomerase/thioredoxin